MARRRGGKQAAVECLTRAQVARLLRVSPTTVTRWAREGRLPSWITLGGHHRFDGAAIEAIRVGMLKVSNAGGRKR